MKLSTFLDFQSKPSIETAFGMNQINTILGKTQATTQSIGYIQQITKDKSR